ncbi:hypothetical protein H6764_01865 [Candidatus Nomurabacteria bacterium]|nr:hypothetical protein [Candidatus Nomurabacteria bacterium]
MKKVHFIGIAGSAMAPIAIMMKKKGWDVTGSDTNVFEPALSLLNENDIKWYEGYDKGRVEDVDLVILGGFPLLGNPNNEEFIHAKELGKQIEGYAYALQLLVVKDISIVVTGSYGKTTTTAIIAWILECAGKEPSFMVGGKPINFPTGVKSTGGDFSVLEGDEFASVYSFDMEPRFLSYKPKYTILSSTKWDHLNIYKTEQSYIDAFIKLAKEVEKNSGVLFICASGENNEKVLNTYNGDSIIYALENRATVIDSPIDYLAANIIHTENNTKFTVLLNDSPLGDFETDMIGEHNVENCLAAIAVCHHLRIDIKSINSGLSTFKGLKRRQEIIGTSTEGSIVIDDFAHSAVKAKSTLEALKTRYKNKKIIAIYQPRSSEREDRNALSAYRGAFDQADLVLLPKMTVKKSVPKEHRIYGKDYAAAISQTGTKTLYIPKDEELIDRIKSESDENTIIVFMSASDWGDLMTQTLNE